MTMTEFDDIFTPEDFKEEPLVDTPVSQPINTEPDIESDDFFDVGSEPKEKDSLVDTFLKTKGFVDGKITILDEDEKEQVINFYDLTQEEQLDILSSSETSTNDLDDAELQLLNHLRSNELSVEQFLQQYKESILAEVSKPAEPNYDIDAYDDQELFLLDLKNKYDLTDEELTAELEKELKNIDIFNKKTAKLRTEYKLLEDEYKTNQQQELQKQKEGEYNQFAQTIVDIAIKTPDFHDIVLEDDEKNETLSYLLDLDDKGISNFYKDLNNPAKLYEAAWYMRYGKEAFDALKNAYEGEITKLKNSDKPRVVVQNANKQRENIYDLI